MDRRNTPIDVVAGVIRGSDERILICLRPRRLHQGGLWEFPGGKRESGESRLAALARELREEIGIELRRATPLLRLKHDYGDKIVSLDVWDVTAWDGSASGLEGQELQWVDVSVLPRFDFPAANATIIAAARLPRVMLVADWTHLSADRHLRALERHLQAGCRLAVVPYSPHGCANFASRAADLATRYAAEFHFFGAPAETQRYPGLHVRLPGSQSTPIPSGRVLSATVGTLEDFRLAESAGAEWIVLASAAASGQEFRAHLTMSGTPAYRAGACSESGYVNAIGEGYQGIVVCEPGQTEAYARCERWIDDADFSGLS